MPAQPGKLPVATSSKSSPASFLLMYMRSFLRTGMISVTSHSEVQEETEPAIYAAIKGRYLTGRSNAL